MPARGYTLLGWAVWKLGRWWVRRRVAAIGTGKKIVAAVALVALIGGAIAVGRGRAPAGVG